MVDDDPRSISSSLAVQPLYRTAGWKSVRYITGNTRRQPLHKTSDRWLRLEEVRQRMHAVDPYYAGVKHDIQPDNNPEQHQQ